MLMLQCGSKLLEDLNVFMPSRRCFYVKRID